MLVRSVQAFKDYTGTRNIEAGKLFVAYAIEERGGQASYFVLPLGAQSPDDEYDPLFFEAENFEIVDDHTSASWTTKEMPVSDGSVQYSSFPEWFVNDFYLRAHDWDLAGDDYQVIRKYKRRYEDLYKSYASS